MQGLGCSARGAAGHWAVCGPGIEIPLEGLEGVNGLQSGQMYGLQAAAIPTATNAETTNRTLRGERGIGFLREGMRDRATTYTLCSRLCQRGCARQC
jgi:hypothetical protein